MDFTCNVCGKLNTGITDFQREGQNCSSCLSTVRTRALMYVLSMELFGTPLALPDFPVLKCLRGLGLSDSDDYANLLAEKFDYKNTFFDREPRLDITGIDGQQDSSFDFIISSEVFEHVRPPVEKAFENAFRLLRPHGMLILSLPYHLDDWPSVEHYPQFADAGIAQLKSGPVLVNRTSEGELQIFDKLIFHGGAGSTLEMRMLNEAALRGILSSTGFTDFQFYGGDYAPFGIRYEGPWSLPIAAHKQPFQWTSALRTETMQRFGELHDKLRRKQTQIGRLENDIQTLTSEVQRLNAENTEVHNDLTARTEWAKTLDQEVRHARTAIEQLQEELNSRTNWAEDLGRELEQRNAAYAQSQTEVETRTNWALDLQRQLAERTDWAISLEARTKEMESELGRLRAHWWSRVGRRLGMVD